MVCADEQSPSRPPPLSAGRLRHFDVVLAVKEVEGGGGGWLGVVRGDERMDVA